MAREHSPSTTAATATFADQTFTTYDSAQSSSYQRSRPPYPSRLIEFVLKKHADTTSSPSDKIVLDVGCGPGTATRSLSPSFYAAHGCDPSSAMIDTARPIKSTTLSGSQITYHVCAAEALQSLPIPPGSVDLVTAAMAAHWFDLPKFYEGATYLLKPGGTLALWTSSSYYCHPLTTPNHERVQKILLDLERNILAPFEVKGNRLSRDMYDQLPLPWTCDPFIKDFPETGFERYEWNRDGVPSNDGTFFCGVEREELDDLAKGLGTASMVTRWREVNRENLENGVVEDCVAMTVRRLKEAMSGRDWIDGGSATALLIFKKQKQNQNQ